jgi:hypothetical protein
MNTELTENSIALRPRRSAVFENCDLQNLFGGLSTATPGSTRAASSMTSSPRIRSQRSPETTRSFHSQRKMASAFAW